MQPKNVNDADMVFGNTNGLMPPIAEIPNDFTNPNSGNKWVQFQREWFYRGVDFGGLVPKPGIDVRKAVRHLATIQGSFEPKHEHKQAAVAYLASLWFDDWKAAAK